MNRLWRAILSGFLSVLACTLSAQVQDKEQSRAMVELASEMLKASQAEDDVRDIMVQAAELDTTNIFANYEAGRLHLKTIRKEEAVKYLLRIYRQNPKYRFDMEFHIASSYQFGLQFDKAIEFYTIYKIKYQRNPTYQGKDKINIREVERRLVECANGKEFVANPKPFAIVNIGPSVNSEFHDYAPVLNEKEDEIIFTSRRIDGNLNENVFTDNKPFEDIFFSTKTGTNWSRAKNIGKTVNIPDHNSNLALSADGKTLFTYRSENGGDIYVSELRGDNSWSAPSPLPAIINSPGMETSVSISKDGSTLYFASERDGGFGGLDIYVATKDGKGRWAKVRNLGPVINTERDEDGPFIDYSGRKLYFSSQSHKGMGGFDIFETNAGPTGEWSKPENLGYPINTPDNDIYFVGTADGKRGYYASVREDGLGYLDIYQIGPKELVAKTPGRTLPVNLLVKVIDAKSGNPLEATVELVSMTDGASVPIKTKAKGNYTFSVVAKDPKPFRLSVKHNGYFTQTEEITLQSADVVEKTETKTVGMATSTRVIENIPLKYVVTVLDGKTGKPTEAQVKLEMLPDNSLILTSIKGPGLYEHSILATTAKQYKLTVSKPGFNQQVIPLTIEGSGTSEKVVTKTVTLEGGLVPVRYVVKVVDSKTNLPINAVVRLDALPEKASQPGTPKGNGLMEFALTFPTQKDFELSAELDGYLPQNQSIKIEAAGATEKVLNKTIALEPKEIPLVPLTFTVKVVDEKTNAPLDAALKLETAGAAALTGTSAKATGVFNFALTEKTSKEFSLTAERDGYIAKSEKITIEAAGTTAKTVTKTIALAVREVPLVPLTLTVKVVDEKTNTPLDAALKLESAGVAALTGTSAKATGVFNFALTEKTSKEFTLTAERDGYIAKSEKITIEAAGTAAKTVTKTIALAVREVPLVPLTLTVKVVDEKTNAPLDAALKLETAGVAALTGTSAKATGIFNFALTEKTSKEFTLTAERDGYIAKSEKITIEAAGTTAKTVTKTIALAVREVPLVPLTFSVKVVDEKTNAPLDAALKLETVGAAALTGTSAKATGVFNFALTEKTSKEFSLTAERDGYIAKSEKITIEAAGTTAKTVTKTIALAVREVPLVPLTFTVKVVDEKTNAPLDAALKLETAGAAALTGTSAKATGVFNFALTEKNIKEFSLTAERDGYIAKSEKITIEAAGPAAKTVTKTIALAVREVPLVPLTFTVKVLDEKTNAPLDAALKLETAGAAALTGTSAKATGVFNFALTEKTSKEFTLTAERDGYIAKSEKITIEAAGTTAKTITKTISLAEIKKDPVFAPITLTIRAVDEKSKATVFAKLKLEGADIEPLTGETGKPTGTFNFIITPKTKSDFTLTAERNGYETKAEKITIDAAGATPKTISRNITLREKAKEPVLVPITLAVKTVDEKGKALEANVTLQAEGLQPQTGATSRQTGVFNFSLSEKESKEFKITAERPGFNIKSETVTFEAAGTTAKTISRTLVLSEIKKEIPKEAPIVPVTLVVTVVDEKTNTFVDASLKLEATGSPASSGTTQKSTGQFSFSISEKTAKEFTLHVERADYQSKSEKINIEAAGTTVKTINRIIALTPIKKAEPTEQTPAADGTMTLLVTVEDSKTKRAIEANVVLKSPADNAAIPGIPKSTGVYEFYLPTIQTKNYKLSADREGYVYQAQQITVNGPNDKGKSTSRTLVLQPIAVGVTSVLRNLYFDIGKATIRSESLPELSGFENMMKKNPTLRVEVSGHTDNVGDDYANKVLSQQRANAVKEFLVSRGIAATRVVAIGLGETKPLVSNDDEMGGREINRRVEIKVLSK